MHDVNLYSYYRTMTNMYMKNILNEQDRAMEEARRECVRNFGDRVLVETMHPNYNYTIRSYTCPAYWDSVMCWPDTPPGTLAIQPCPSYVAGFLPMNNASRQCTESGVWFINQSLNQTWTNLTTCFPSAIINVTFNVSKTNIATLLETALPVLKIVSETGYLLSFSTLIIAFAIMFFIKKLHCARNILHMHLFASFILRAFVVTFVNSAFVHGIGLPSDMDYRNGSLFFNTKSETNNWTCKFVTSLWHYFILANYSWILMEGLYLHNLIFRALFADSSNSIRWYVVLGWGLPLVIIACWVITRVLVEDTLCWRTLENYNVFLIIVIPTFTSNLINTLLFIRVSMVLYKKLRSPIYEDSRRYQKWMRSTLVLVPLFGIHYAIGMILYYSMGNNKVVEMIWLISDQLFGSLQGFFVAILYCFLNGEVKAEIQPHIYYFLTFLATNRCSKYFFPCRKKFLRSVVGRSSVCTTMSCSSLYTNGVLHRNSKCRLDSLPKGRGEYLPPSKAALQGDKPKDHICHNNPRRNSKSHRRCSHELHRHSQPFNFGTAETMLYNERNVCRSEPEINEETLRMVVNF